MGRTRMWLIDDIREKNQELKNEAVFGRGEGMVWEINVGIGKIGLDWITSSWCTVNDQMLSSHGHVCEQSALNNNIIFLNFDNPASILCIMSTSEL